MIKPFLAQMRSAQAMRALSPQLAELRRRHGDDHRRLAEETRTLQHAHGVNPLGALAPALIQVPVFLALLHVPCWFNRPGLTFEQNAAIPNYVFGPAQVRSFLEARLFGTPLSAWLHTPLHDPNTESTGPKHARATLCRVRHRAGRRQEESCR